MEAQDRILAELEEAIDFVNKVHLRFQHRRQQYKLFLDVLLKFQRGRNLVHHSLASLFDGHPDLQRTFQHFLSHSKPSPLSETVSTEHRDALKRLETLAHGFLLKVSRVLDLVYFVSFMDHIYQCRVQELDRDVSRTVIAEYIGDFPDLMEEYENFWEVSAKVKASLSTVTNKRKRSSSADQPCLKRRSSTDSSYIDC